MNSNSFLVFKLRNHVFCSLILDLDRLITLQWLRYRGFGLPSVGAGNLDDQPLDALCGFRCGRPVYREVFLSFFANFFILYVNP